MYQLEQYLSNHNTLLKEVIFQVDEANTDRYLKERIKEIIEMTKNELLQDIDINKFEEVNLGIVDSKEIQEIISNVTIEQVLLPENITPDIKRYIYPKATGPITLPDICLELTAYGQIHYEAIELKSTKTDTIPGSSIQQISPDEWVIFVKHTKVSVEIATGKYINTINAKMQFPDRSPRPQVSFKELYNWNKKYRKFEDKQFIVKEDNAQLEKYNLLEDWQTVLCNRWIDMLFNSTNTRANKPWFNQALQKFSYQLIEKYTSLSPAEQKEFMKKLKE